MIKISRLALVILLFWSVEAAGAQSLWSPGFKGYLTGTNSLEVGDLISISIDTNTKLSYTSSNVSDRTITIEFHGAAAGNPLSFLPAGTSGGNSSLKGGEEIKLATNLVARVQRLDALGNAYVQGSRTLEVNGREEMLTVSGWVDPSMPANGKGVGFDKLADSKLVYSSTLLQTHPVLTQADIAQALAQTSPPAVASPAPSASSPAAAPPAAAPPPSTTGPSAAAPAAAAGTTAAGLQITEAKKRELLLEYLNKMLDLIFSKATP